MNYTDLGAILLYLFREKFVVPTDWATLLLPCLRLLVKFLVKQTQSTQRMKHAGTVYRVAIHLTPKPSPLHQELAQH